MATSRFDIRDVLDYGVAYDSPVGYDEPVAYAPPAAHPTTIELYASLGPLRTGDSDRGWPLLGFVSGAGELLGFVDDLARDTDEGPGWSALVDLGRAPVSALPWLGQFVGTRISGERVAGELYTDTQRTAVGAKDSWNRGQRERIRTVVQELLNGTQYVVVHERTRPDQDGDFAYRLMIDVIENEAPPVEELYAAVYQFVPAGIIVDFRLVPGIATWATIRNADWATWNAEDWAGSNTIKVSHLGGLNEGF